MKSITLYAIVPADSQNPLEDIQVNRLYKKKLNAEKRIGKAVSKRIYAPTVDKDSKIVEVEVFLK